MLLVIYDYSALFFQHLICITNVLILDEYSALVFIEMWKRKQASLQYDWDVEDYEREEVIKSSSYLCGSINIHI